MGIKVLSCFDGMSCGKIALDRAGVKIDRYLASEIKPHAINVSRNNNPSIVQVGDVTKLTRRFVGEVDLLIGGSPCQDFSQANRERKGLGGVKSVLFYEYLRLLEQCSPEYFLLENVKMKREHQDMISNYLGVQPININSKLVSAQLRNRFYWTNIPFHGIEDRGIKLQGVLDNGYTDREKSRALLEADSRPLNTPVKMFHRYYSTGFTTLVFKDEQHYLDCKEHYDNNYKGVSAGEIECNSDVYDGLRYLNQRELERLQTIPEGYTDILTRNKAASVLGDGWTVDVLVEFFKNLK